jgi:hypothetical protein
MHRPAAPIVIASMLASLPCAASASGYLDAYHGGTVFDGMGSVSTNLCGASATLTGDASCIFLNPAGLSGLDGGTVNLTWGYLNWKERRRYGLSSVFFSDELMTPRMIAGAASLAPGLVAGLGAAPVANADYFGMRYVLADPTGEIEYSETLEASGTQWEALAGASAEILEGLDLGVSAGYRFGTVEVEYSRFDYWTEEIDSTAAWSLETAEPALHVGALSRSALTTIGLSYSPGGSIAPVLSGGIRILAPHLQNIVVGIEGDLLSPLARNDYSGRIYIDYPFNVLTHIRTGVSFKGFPSETGSGMGISMGATRLFGRMRVDAGMLWRNRVLDGGYIEGEDSDRVEESSMELVLGLTLVP